MYLSSLSVSVPLSSLLQPGVQRAVSVAVGLPSGQRACYSAFHHLYLLEYRCSLDLQILHLSTYTVRVPRCQRGEISIYHTLAHSMDYACNSALIIHHNCFHLEALRLLFFGFDIIWPENTHSPRADLLVYLLAICLSLLRVPSSIEGSLCLLTVSYKTKHTLSFSSHSFHRLPGICRY